MKTLCSLFFLSTLLLLFAAPSRAGIQLDSTRVIYPANKREVTLALTNHAETPRLIQAWIDAGDSDISPAKNAAPFIVTPPIFRLDPDKRQTLRIVFIGGNVPQDRESVFWLNVLEVQPKPIGKAEGAQDYIQFSVHSRLKIFYRPQGLSGSPEDAVSTLRWHAVDGGLECENSSAFNVSINNIWFKEGMENTENKHNGMCPAKGKKTFLFQQTLASNNNNMFFSVINDYGAFNTNKAHYQD